MKPGNRGPDSGDIVLDCRRRARGLLRGVVVKSGTKSGDII